MHMIAKILAMFVRKSIFYFPFYEIFCLSHALLHEYHNVRSRSIRAERETIHNFDEERSQKSHPRWKK